MAVIIRNNGAVPWWLNDTSPRIKIKELTELDLETHLSLAEIAASTQLLGDIANAALSLTVSDGAKDLTVGEAVRHILQRPTPGPTSEDGTPLITERPLLLGRDSLKRTDDGSESMNIDGRPVGSVITVWNGTGASDIGGDWTISGTGSEQAAADAGDGTNGWDTGVTVENDDFLLDNGSLLDIVGSYSSIRFMINPQAFPAMSRPRIGFLDATDTLVGSACRIDSYVSNMDLGVWQQVEIPIEDFGLAADVQKIRVQCCNTSGQHYYFDDFEFIPAGGAGPYRFRIKPPTGERWHLSMLVLQVTAPESGWNSDAFANISGGLTNGLILRQRRQSDGETLWRFVTRDNKEMFGQYHPQESFAFADGTLLLGFMVKPGKAAVIVTEDDVLEFVVRDDLSSISSMRAYMHYGVEVV